MTLFKLLIIHYKLLISYIKMYDECRISVGLAHIKILVTLYVCVCYAGCKCRNVGLSRKSFFWGEISNRQRAAVTSFSLRCESVVPSLWVRFRERTWNGLGTEVKRTWGLDTKLHQNNGCFIFRKKHTKKLKKIRDNHWRFQKIFVPLQSDSCSGRDLTGPTFFKP